MERGDQRECELERELEGLYRKVAGLDQPADCHERMVPTVSGTAPRHVRGQGATGAGSGRQRGRRFRVRPYWGLALLPLGVIGLFWWQGWWGAAAPQAPSAGDGGGGVIVLAAEETVGHPAPPPGEPTAAASPPADRPTRYAIQVRAYPEQQKQKALLFMAELRGRGSDVSLETVSTAERGVWHRILLGDFSTVEEAAEYRAASSVAREYPYGFIQRKYANAPRPAPAPRSASAVSPVRP